MRFHPPISWLLILIALALRLKTFSTKGRGYPTLLLATLKFKPHPDADRLRIAQVDIGSETVQIVTAATNVNDGDKIPVSLPGAVLAGGLKIKRQTAWC